MGRLRRQLRAAAAVLLLAGALLRVGGPGAAPVLAGEAPDVALHGELVDDHDVGLRGVHLRITEELPPDGAIAGFEVQTGPDGLFTVELYPWGTVDGPAIVTISTAAGEQIVVQGDPCSQTLGVSVTDTRQLALSDAAHPPKPVDVVAVTTLLGEVCGTQATPPPDGAGASASTQPGTGGSGEPAASASGGARGSSGGDTGGRHLTPPPTDSGATLGSPTERLGPALSLGFVLGLALALLLRRPRPGRNHGD